jgi:hypothetical protein
MTNKLPFFWLMTTIESLAALAFLLLIPPDPKNAWLLGYSLPRIAMAIGIAMIGATALGITLGPRNSARLESMWMAWIQRISTNDLLLFIVFVILFGTVLLGLVFLNYWIFSEDALAYRALLTRMAPLILLLSAISLHLLWLIKSWSLVRAVYRYRVWILFPLVVRTGSIFASGLVGDLASQIEASGAETVLAKDAAHYYQMAESFSHFDFSMTYILEQRAHRQPLYPLLLALPFRTFDGDVFPLTLVNVGLTIVFLIMAYFYVYKLLGSVLAGLAVILFTISDPFLPRYVTTQLLTEPLFLLLSFAATVQFLFYIQRKRNRHLYAAAALAGLTYLARANGLFIILTMTLVILGYEIWQAARQRSNGASPYKEMVRKYSVFAAIIILITLPSWLPRMVYTGNPFYHDYLPNFMWVDTYEEGHIQGPPRYSMQDYFAEHDLGDVIDRVEFGLEKVFYADTIIGYRWPYSILIVAGLLIACLSLKTAYLLLTAFMFLQSLPIVWTYMANPTLRIPYVGLFPFAVIYLAVFVSAAIQILRRVGEVATSR